MLIHGIIKRKPWVKTELVCKKKKGGRGLSDLQEMSYPDGFLELKKKLAWSTALCAQILLEESWFPRSASTPENSGRTTTSAMRDPPGALGTQE